MRLNPGLKAIRRMIGASLALALATASFGCASAWWNSFIDPTQVGNFRENVIMEIQDTVSFEDKPSGIPNAVDPTPEDLVATVEGYRLGPGDVFQVTMLDFLARGSQSEFVVMVDDLGYVEIPQLGRIRVEGLSLPEIKAELIRQSQAKGIYSEDIEPTITLTMGDQQNRIFNISGAVQTPGTYRIGRVDTRLREALNMAGGMGEISKFIYVFRDEPRHRRVLEQAANRLSTAGSEPQEPEYAPAERNMAVMRGPAPEETGQAQPSRRPREPQPALPNEEVEQDLIQAIAPAGTSPGPGGEGTQEPVPSTNEAAPPLRPFIFVNDKLIEAPPPPQTVPTMPTTPATVQTAPQVEQATRPVDWEELAGEGQQRIIRIPAEALRNGDSSLNIVIRHQDWIRVDPGPIGNYYIGGHVVMPGQYPLNGELVTLTQAMITARGLDPLAWPTRCEIRRRIDRDREQITQWDLARITSGQDPDVFIRPNDVINIGTHSIAPLLYTIRNAFRFNYGFSFAYDRNWAEYDTLAGQYYRSRTEATRRGLLSPWEF